MKTVSDVYKKHYSDYCNSPKFKRKNVSARDRYATDADYKETQNKRSTAWYHSNKGKAKKQKKRWYKLHKEKIAEKYRLKKQFIQQQIVWQLFHENLKLKRRLSYKQLKIDYEMFKHETILKVA